jgi:Protein of unknown function (DUF3616)
MANAILLGRVLLRFGETDAAQSLIGQLSAAAIGPDGALWVASDELSEERVAISRLTLEAPGVYAGHRVFALDDYVPLIEKPGEGTEADLEGLDCAAGYLWFTGSHSSKRPKPKGKNPEKDLQRLAEVRIEPNRYLLGRIPLQDGVPVKSAPPGPGEAGNRTAARLADGKGGNALVEALLVDPHLGPFLRTVHAEGGDTDELLPLASKENGFDIEGLAVFEKRLFLGLRGPVLRGWAMLLEIEPEDQSKGLLGLAPVQAGGGRCRKHFLDLGGLGVRELGRDGDDLLILAGPTMALDGTIRLFRLRDAAGLGENSVTGRADGRLTFVFELPMVAGADYAEGFASIRWRDQSALLFVYDAPAEARRPSAGTVFADVFWMHA